jgi:serine/threonine-protein kinase SRPK3
VNTNEGLDITPNNVLHRISGLDGLDEDEVLQILGSPVVNPVLNACKECHYESTAPQYLVYPVSWWDVDTQFISKESCLTDFGESFEISQPPDDLGIPGPYRSPELILDKEAGFGSDIWALGCSLFEIRTGRKLFSSFDDEDNDYLDAIVQVLGKLPEPWWSTTWEDRRKMYKDEVDEQGLAVAASVGTDWIDKRPIDNRANFSIIDYRLSITIIIDLGGEGPGRIYPSYSLF